MSCSQLLVIELSKVLRAHHIKDGRTSEAARDMIQFIVEDVMVCHALVLLSVVSVGTSSCQLVLLLVVHHLLPPVVLVALCSASPIAPTPSRWGAVIFAAWPERLVSETRPQKHGRDWDSNADYRMGCFRKGMTREKYVAHIVGPFLAINADDTPPDLPDVPLGIPSVARLPST